MERYSEYKDSGVNWLGKIPGHWKAIPLRRIAQVNPSKKKDLSPDDYVGYAPMDRIRCDQMVPTKIKVSQLTSGLTYCEQGDIVLAKVTPCFENGNLAIVPKVENGCCYASSELFVFRPKTNVLDRFLFYTFLNRSFIDAGASTMRGTGGLKRVTTEFANTAATPLPPLSEQHSIVSYLDDKCAKIDKSVEDMEKQIVLLQEMKQRVIADAVTRGLDKTVKFKKTNIAWLPEVPEHWEISNLRKFLKIFSEKGHGDKQLLSVTREQGVIVRDVESKEENHNFIPEDLSGYKFVQRGDFVINKMKSWQGSYGVSLYDGIVSPAYYTCKLDGVDADFFSVAIRSKSYVPFFGQYSKGIRVDQWDLSPISLKTIPFMLPPIEEQRTIVSYINERTAKIETLAKKIEQEIVYLKEYKQRLIADCVTGQIKVC